MNKMKAIIKKIFKSKIKLIAITISVIFCAATIYAAAASSYTVTINVGASSKNVLTLKTDAYSILDDAGIEIGENDIVDLSEFKSYTDCSISVYKPCNVTVFDGDTANEYTGIIDVATTLNNNGISVSADDAIDYELTHPVVEGMEIHITRAFPVTLSADGEIFEINIAGGTVSDALDKAVIAVDDDDIISKPLESELEKGMTIKVTRIDYSERKETSEIAFKTVDKKTADLVKGQSKITQKGVNGEKITTYKDKYVDGVLVESTAVGTEVTKKAVDQIRLVGTKAVPSSGISAFAPGDKLAKEIKTLSTLKAPSNVVINSNGVPTSYKKKIVGTASAYSGGGVTATGRKAQCGYIAVNPNQIPYHTKMWIVSNDNRYVYGYASAEDTGGFTKWTGSRATLCDLYFPSEASASAFGRRSITIYVL